MGETGALFLLTVPRIRPTVPPTPPQPQSLLEWLAGKYPTAKRQTLRRMVQAGRVTVNGRVARKAGDAVGVADRIIVSDQTIRASQSNAPAPRRGPKLKVLYEDADLLVVVKPAGLLTSTVPRERRPTLLAMVRRHVEEHAPGGDARGLIRVGLIHRLDRDASGLLVFSKNHETYRSLKQQFFDHTVERVYTAVVKGVPTPRAGRIESRLLERADGTVRSTKRPAEGEWAATEYEVVDEAKGRAVLRVKLHTGRKHQIRVHLSERGVPIIGDTMYGEDNDAPEGRLLLEASRLSLTHPRTGERKKFELPKPAWAQSAPAPKSETEI